LALNAFGLYGLDIERHSLHTHGDLYRGADKLNPIPWLKTGDIPDKGIESPVIPHDSRTLNPLIGKRPGYMNDILGFGPFERQEKADQKRDQTQRGVQELFFH
jgi:hypothetical protein